ncbi:unnamed protein product [Gadus morhua 'NCC']
MFYIVEFLDEVTGDGKPMVDIIPTRWFKNDDQVECYWPVGLNVSISKAVKRMVQPDPSTWATCQVRVLGSAVTFAAARSKLKKAEATSDVQTEPENSQRQLRPTQKLREVLSSDESEVCPEDVEPPTPPRELSKKVSQQRSCSRNSSWSSSPPESPGPSNARTRSPRSTPSPIGFPSLDRQRSTAALSLSTTIGRQTSPLIHSPSETPRRSHFSLSQTPRPNSQSETQTPRHSQPSSSRTSSSGMEQQMFIPLFKLLEEVKDTQRVHTRLLNNLLKQKRVFKC